MVIITRMDDQAARGFKIFLMFWALFAALAAMNLYGYFKLGSKLSLVGGVICAVVFVSWAVFYCVYVRRAK